MVRADMRHVGRSLSDFRPNGTYTRAVDAYDLVNARVGVERKDGWGLYLFATNLFNDVAITRATSNAIQTGRTIVTSAPPRTIGLNLRTQF
jgi:outer membrane receptor protein involved in Fe transport